MAIRFLTFRLIITAIILLCTIYVGQRIISRLQLEGAQKVVVWIFLGAFVVSQIFSGYAYRMYPDNFVTTVLQWTSYGGLGVFAIFFFTVLLSDIYLLACGLLMHDGYSVDLERRSFVAFGSLAIAASAVGFAQAVRGPKVYEVEIPIANLPDDLNGFRIVQISDLHIGPTIKKEYAEKVVEMANSLQPDLIALTGDFSDGDVELLRPAIAPLENLKAKHGSYFVTGNHEYYWDPEGWLNEYRALGAKILTNEHVVITEKTTKLVIAGVTDHTTGGRILGQESDPHKALVGAPQGVKILLAHQPESHVEAAKAGFDLQISGHTHAGQFFPFSLFMPLAHRYYVGLNKHENMWIYVNRGTGYWGPPQRFAIPSEVTLLRLVKA